MALFKCKSCGGDLIIEDNSTVCECEYCGTKQPIPSIRDENLQNLFNRANVLRMKSEFDKAAGIYEKIIQKEEGEAEAYWGLILCRYGIEYVEDPETFKRIPTCHRASFESITADDDYKSALQYADLLQKRLYEEEAKKIDEIQKGILALAQKDDPFDVFICYKETDESGKRTQDSVIANDIYYQLTQEGFKVFYAAITLEDKLGSEYEPHIFAALNTAKVMLVLGTKPEYFNAVWVKNEWSRFLAMMKKDRSKMLIPCYRDMDPYELPEEFSHLQAQDMSKIGFINDITRGIKKVLAKDEPKPVKETVTAQKNTAGTNVAPLLERAFMFLEDGDWEEADTYCEKVLDQDPKNAKAYLGKLMAELKVRKQGDLKNCAQPFDGSNNYQKALRFADPTLAETLKGYITSINERISKYALECQPYNTSNTDVTWESCSLRKWLNDDFLNEAFSKKEQSIIAKTDISADKNPEYSTNPGNATTDKIFLLSITEAEKYFTTDESRKCAPTAYAESQGAWTLNHCKTASGEVTCRWWLRSPGETHGDAADVDNGGSVYCRGWSVDSGYACVRPALWINLDS